MSIIWTIIILCVLITVHELGHFAAAKLSNVGVSEFAIGMGPVIYKRERKGTVYSIRALPIGGFCKMLGEDEDSFESNSLNNASKMQRFFIFACGALMNLILGLLIFLVITLSAQAISVPVIGEIIPGSAAEEIGLQAGDRIVQLDKTRINLQSDVLFETSRIKDKPVTVTVERNGERFTAPITLRHNAETGTYLIGYKSLVTQPSLVEKLEIAFYQTLFMGKIVTVSLFDLITGNANLNNVAGPVGMASEIGNAAKSSFIDLLYLTGLITINLGIFNLLPFPALDGGRIIFLGVEAIIRRRVPPKVEGIIHTVGFLLLITLMIIVTSNDIMKLFKLG